MQGLELIYIIVLGMGIGLAVRYLVPGRSAHGLLLMPAVGTALAAVAWVAFTWLGWPADEPGIWFASLGVSLAGSVAAAILLARMRARADEHRLHVLSGGKVR